MKCVAPEPFFIFSSFLTTVLYIKRTVLMTSAMSTSSVLASSMAVNAPLVLPTAPAWFSKNLKASTIICMVSLRSSAIVIIAMTPL